MEKNCRQHRQDARQWLTAHLDSASRELHEATEAQGSETTSKPSPERSVDDFDADRVRHRPGRGEHPQATPEHAEAHHQGQEIERGGDGVQYIVRHISSPYCTVNGKSPSVRCPSRATTLQMTR